MASGKSAKKSFKKMDGLLDRFHDTFGDKTDEVLSHLPDNAAFRLNEMVGELLDMDKWSRFAILSMLAHYEFAKQNKWIIGKARLYYPVETVKSLEEELQSTREELENLRQSIEENETESDLSSIEQGRPEANGQVPWDDPEENTMAPRFAKSIKKQLAKASPQDYDAAELFQGVDSKFKDATWSLLDIDERRKLWRFTTLDDKINMIRLMAKNTATSMFLMSMDDARQSTVQTTKKSDAETQTEPKAKQVVHPTAPKRPDDKLVSFVVTPDCNKQQLWSRIVAAVPDASIRSCRQKSDALEIRLENSEQANLIRAIDNVHGAGVKQLKQT